MTGPIDFDRIEGWLGVRLADWQRGIVQAAFDHPGSFVTVAAPPRRAGFTAIRRALELVMFEPWLMPDRPYWPRFQLVRLPARLEQALDLLIARRSNHAHRSV